MTVGFIIALVLICLSLIGLILAAIYKYFETRKKLEVANQEIDNLKKRDVSLSNIVLQDIVNNKELQLNEKENKINQLKNEIYQLKINLNKLEQEIGDRRKNLAENLINTRKVIELEGKNKLLEESMNDLNREKDKLINENKELKENNQNLINEKKNSDDVSNALSEGMKKDKIEIDALKQKNKVLDENLKKIDEENKKLNEQIEKISNKSDIDVENIVGEVLKEYTRKQVQMVEEIQKLQSQIKNLKSDNDALKNPDKKNNSLLADLSQGKKKKNRPNEITFDKNNTLVNGKIFISSRNGSGSLFNSISKTNVVEDANNK